MDDFRLNTFRDGSLIDDLVIGPGCVSIMLVGRARYEISMSCESGRHLLIALWTTKKGLIETRYHDEATFADVRLGSDGNLAELHASDCLLHLEHMDRGHYLLGLENDHAQSTGISFLTAGYIKTRIIKHVVPT